MNCLFFRYIKRFERQSKDIKSNILHNKSKFIVLVDNIKELLRKEITENECTDIEMDQIVNLYNYVQKEVINI